ncbi:ERV/ALR sulfhydryl oxidase domain-containing protein [Chaetomium sp. MPI-CAGE-AT-0009]|nr:ERV/ALR sulfhydryl oxidase domain-containing protein [Chaetomium sp. MPI-CAGE-AT-0009]
MARRHLTLTLMAVMLFLSLTYFMAGKSTVEYSPTTRLDDASHPTYPDSASDSNPAAEIPDRILQGGSIAPKLGNATAKAELGRASWKLLHTMMARFPEAPTADESLALETYVRLFARLYPCGECAAHFQKLLRKYPPQTSGRNAAAGWACFVHNEVNRRLKKEEFDCNKIGDFYDCGCGEEEGKKKEGEGSGEVGKGDELKGREGVTVEKEEGLTRGG